MCKENHFKFNGLWHKWGSYGFEKDGRLRFEEYYPNALEDTYKGIEGYIYSCSKIDPYQKLDIKIPNTFITAQKTTVDNCEFIPDAYNEMINAEANGLITILRYNEFIMNMSSIVFVGLIAVLLCFFEFKGRFFYFWGKHAFSIFINFGAKYF